MSKRGSKSRDEPSIVTPNPLIGEPLGDLSGFVPGKCINCGASALGHRLLYCNDRCQQIAELVRYARRKIAEGTFDRPDIAEAITSRRSQLIFGFYDKRAREVLPGVRRMLLKSSGGVCANCGRSFAATVDERFTVQHSVSESGTKLEA